MAFLTRSGLLGFLLILAALPLPPASAAGEPEPPPPAAGESTPSPSALSIEQRLARIAAAVRARQGQATQGNPADKDAGGTAEGQRLAYTFLNGPAVGFRNGGFRNGGFRNGGYYGPGRFANGGGGFWNARSGGGAWRNGGGGWRNYW